MPLQLWNKAAKDAQQWNKVAKDALCATLAISDDVRAVFVCTEDLPQDLENKWNQMVLEPAKAAGVKPPELVVLQSPYGFLVSPIVELRVACENPPERVIGMVPELVEDRWYNCSCIHTARLY